MKECVQEKNQEQVKDYLIKIIFDNGKLDDDEFKELLDKLVEEGQREIISTDLIQVIEDAIDQQIQWSDVQEKENFLKTGRNIVQSLFANIQGIINITTSNSEAEELNLIQEIDKVINSLYSLKAFRKKDLQKAILEIKNSLEKIEQDIMISSQNLFSKQVIFFAFSILVQNRLHKIALTLLQSYQRNLEQFSNQLSQLNKLDSYFDQLDSRLLKNYNRIKYEIKKILKRLRQENSKELEELLQESLRLSQQDIKHITDIILLHISKIDDEKMYEFLSYILTAINRELEQIQFQKKDNKDSIIIAEIENKLKAINQKIEPLAKAFPYLIGNTRFKTRRPKYNYITDTLDPTVTIWTATELAEESLAKLTSDDGKIEDYFQNLYRIGEEELGKDVPLPVRSRWLRKSVLILRDILVSWQGKKIENNPIYVFCGAGLSVYDRLKPSDRVLNLSLLVMVSLFLFLGWKLLLVAKAKFFAIAIFIIIFVILVLLLLKLIAYLFSLIFGD